MGISLLSLIIVFLVVINIDKIATVKFIIAVILIIANLTFLLINNVGFNKLIKGL
jgi:hypothetical protein